MITNPKLPELSGNPDGTSSVDLPVEHLLFIVLSNPKLPISKKRERLLVFVLTNPKLPELSGISQSSPGFTKTSYKNCKK